MVKRRGNAFRSTWNICGGSIGRVICLRADCVDIRFRHFSLRSTVRETVKGSSKPVVTSFFPFARAQLAASPPFVFVTDLEDRASRCIPIRASFLRSSRRRLPVCAAFSPRLSVVLDRSLNRTSLFSLSFVRLLRLMEN